MSKEQTEQTSLLDFGFLETINDAVNNELRAAEETQETTETTEGVKDEPEKKVEEVEKKTEETSTEEGSGEDEDGEDPKDSTETIEATSYGKLMQEGIDAGIFEYDEEKDYEDSLDGIKELVEDNKQAAIKTYKESLPEEGVRLLEHLNKGFSVDDFIADSNELIDFDAIDMTTEENQEMIVAYDLEQQGLNETEIAAQIEAFKSADLLEKFAGTSRTKLHAAQEHEQKVKEEKRLLEIETNKTRIEEEKAQFKAKVENTREIKGIKLSENDATSLHDYITKPVGRNGETQFALDDAKNTDESRLFFAYLMQKGFDFKKLETKAKNKANFKLKQRLDDAKSVGASGSKGVMAEKRNDSAPSADELKQALNMY